MAQNKIAQEQVIARNVTFDDWMKHYAEDHTEWVEGTVIKLSPVTEDHDSLDGFLFVLLKFYLEETDEAVIRRHPFVMRIKPGSPGREPDIHIVLKERAHILQRTLTAGPADIVIEIVSEESVERDTETKFEEYQAGGVREYWLFNPIDKTTKFYLLEGGKYRLVELQDGVFQSTVLSRFRLDTRRLWRAPLPTNREILALVEAMLKEAD
ncbi:MAG: Uma2 family endonuclease [Chloroflexi bacterium]|nr:Uma2 family endonuclease [Chloroflexota bacterium]